MRRRARASVIAAVVVTAVIAAVTLLPRSHSSIAHIAVGAASGAPRRALDMLGRSTVNGADSETTTTVPSTTPVPASSTVPPTSTPTSKAPRPPGTGLAPSSTPATTTTAAPPVARAGPATGRLAVTLVQPSGARAIATMAADGTGERVLATGDYIDPHWSPDGRFVLFESMGAFTQLQVSATGGPVTNLGDGAVGIVSPDSTRVINVMAVPGTTNPPPLAVQNVAQTPSGLVTVGPATPLGVSGVAAVWSPDGRRIVYFTAMGGSSDLAIVNADGSGRHDLLAGSPVRATEMDHLSFSADSSTISFLGSDSVEYRIGADGQGLRPALTGGIPGVASLGAFATSASADHQRLALLVNGGNTVVVIDAAGHVVATAHLSAGAAPVGIALDASGQWVFYMGLDGHVYAAAFSGGASQRVGTDNAATFPLSVFAGQ